MRTRILLAASVVAVGAALTVSAPALAQQACDINGAAQAAPAGTDTLVCGTPSIFGVPSGFNSTGVGVDNSALFDNATAIGSNSLAGPIGGVFAAAAAGYLPPAGTRGATAVGAYSYAGGEGSVAIGDEAGVGILVTGGGGPGSFGITGVNFGTAIGSESLVTGANGTAVGAQSRALAANGVAVGYQADAFTAAGGTSIGTQSRANAVEATALGYLSGGTGINSVSVGARSDAQGSGSTAVGWDANATALQAVAIGRTANATHSNSVAIGAGTNTTAVDQVHVGGRTISGVNAGVALTDAVNVSQLNAATGGIAADISGLEAMDAILDSRIDDVDDRSSSGSAVAIAMGGAAFLPDKPFNISGNLGFYRGAWAGAMNINALVSPNAAINAGLGAGFNKKGKIGGRVGFTYGF